LEKNIKIWLEIHEKRAKGQAKFRGCHSNVDHLVTLKIIVEEFLNNKSNLHCCFIDFKKDFETVPRTNHWNRLEEIKVCSQLRVVVVRLYESVISKLSNIEG
jgi:hypothetical protein